MRIGQLAPQKGYRGTTRANILVAIGCVVLLMFLPHGLVKKVSRDDADRIRCVGNIKQIGLAFRIFANEHDETLPFNYTNTWMYPSNSTGIGGNVRIDQNTETLKTWHIFQTLSNELASPKVLMCPKDAEREPNEADHFRQDNEFATPYSTEGNSATSYFIGLNADETRPTAILSGDRNLSLASNTNRIIRGITLFQDSEEDMNRAWVNSSNEAIIHGSQGNLGLADGSVTQVSTQKLPTLLNEIREEHGTNVLLFIFPNE